MQKMPSLPLYPTQLIEAGVNFALFGLLFFIAGKFKKPGRVAGLYVVCYAVLRFLMEFMWNGIWKRVSWDMFCR